MQLSEGTFFLFPSILLALIRDGRMEIWEQPRFNMKGYTISALHCLLLHKRKRDFKSSLSNYYFYFSSTCITIAILMIASPLVSPVTHIQHCSWNGVPSINQWVLLSNGCYGFHCTDVLSSPCLRSIHVIPFYSVLNHIPAIQIFFLFHREKNKSKNLTLTLGPDASYSSSLSSLPKDVYIVTFF